MRKMVEWHEIPYHHLPKADSKEAHDTRFLEIVKATDAELTVVARYMQILSD